MSFSFLIGTYVLGFIGIIIIFLLVFYYDKHSKALKTSYTQELLRTRLEIQEQTFKSVSQEIHDNIGQLLSLAKLNLNRINTSKLGPDESKLNDAKELISRTIKDLRDLSKTLNTESIEGIGLLRAIQTEIKLIQNADSKRVDLEVQGTIYRVDAQKELFLYRIFQEAVHNILKHARASAIQILVIYKEKSIELTISDNGCGFDQSEENHEGNGLRNMKNRSKLIGAKLRLISTPQSGTMIHIYLPINE